VKWLRDALQRNTTVSHRFLCFTDQPELVPVEAVKIKPVFELRLNKFMPFAPEFGLKGRVLNIDLDTVIMDNIDRMLLRSDKFITTRRMNGVNAASGAITLTDAEYGRELYEQIKEQPELVAAQCNGWDGRFMRKYVSGAVYWQNIESGIYSYKLDCLEGMPDDARIINFHGRPRPHEVANLPFMRRHWRVLE
jgi:hypothetical protein